MLKNMKPKNIMIFGAVFLVMAIIILMLKIVNISLAYQIDSMKIEFDKLYSQNKKLRPMITARG